jgi:hypothetical protein
MMADRQVNRFVEVSIFLEEDSIEIFLIKYNIEYIRSQEYLILLTTYKTYIFLTKGNRFCSLAKRCGLLFLVYLVQLLPPLALLLTDPCLHRSQAPQILCHLFLLT